MGIPLFRIKDIRVLYGEEPWADSVIDFISPRNKPLPKGHVIATRITSENPDEVRLYISLVATLSYGSSNVFQFMFLTSGCLSPSVCLFVWRITQKRMFPKCSNLEHRMTLGYTRSDMILGLKGQGHRVTKCTNILNLNEWLA